jgi:hypothetical protein
LVEFLEFGLVGIALAPLRDSVVDEAFKVVFFLMEFLELLLERVELFLVSQKFFCKFCNVCLIFHLQRLSVVVFFNGCFKFLHLDVRILNLLYSILLFFLMLLEGVLDFSNVVFVALLSEILDHS